MHIDWSKPSIAYAAACVDTADSNSLCLEYRRLQVVQRGYFCEPYAAR